MNGVCLSLSRGGVYCDSGEEGEHYTHAGFILNDCGLVVGDAWWDDDGGTLDPKGLPKHPPRTCLDGCRWWMGPVNGCGMEMETLLGWSVWVWIEGNRTGKVSATRGVRPNAPPCPGFDRGAK